jgi:exodeoxyribonuclease VII small subunit
MSTPRRALKFEEAMKRLDAIVEGMESGELGIEESVARYEEAMQLAAQCRKILDDAELRIRRIQLDASGQMQAEPFAPPEGAAQPNDDGP